MTKSKLILCDEEKLIKEEKERLRKLRLIQVREISKQNAALVRDAFRKEKEKETRNFLSKSESVKKQKFEENLDQIEKLVKNEIDTIGEGHLQAINYDDHFEERYQQAMINREKALVRGVNALDAERDKKMTQENKENAHIIARRCALELERQRAAKIAKLPRVAVDEEAEHKSKSNKKQLVSMHDINVFTTTRYHMPESFVDKAVDGEQEPDARTKALDEEDRQSRLKNDLSRTRQEYMEKARLRGKHALEKEILNENYAEILNELDMLEKADREKRQKELGNIPKEIFVPLWQREQDKNEFQLELERQFEKIYVDSNLRSEEMPQPIDIQKSETVTESQLEDADLDLTILDETNHQKDQPVVEQPQHQLPPKPQSQPQLQLVQDSVNSKSVDMTSSDKQNVILNKLLEKIRTQKRELSEKAKSDVVDGTASSLDSSCMSTESSVVNEPSVKTDPKKHSQVEVKTRSENEEPIDDDESTSSSSLLSTASSTEADDDEPQKDTSRKQMRGIMMSSHNVSSLNEHLIDTNRMILNQKIVSSYSRTGRFDAKNTATCSVDLSHASRDPMLAGAKELQNKNEAKLAIEYKQKQLQRQQEQLEKRLRELEEQEQHLKMESLDEIVANADSSELNANSSHSVKSYRTTTSDTLTSETSGQRAPTLNDEDLKRIEYQRRLLAKYQDPSQSNYHQIDYARQIDERKKEIAKRFGLTDSLPNIVQPNTPQLDSRKQSVVSNTGDDKHTIYSGDSGFASAPTSNQRPVSGAFKKPLNVAVEQLNHEVIKTTAVGAKQPNDVDEYKRRLSLISNSSSLSSSSITQMSSAGFGLEFYDSNNLSDVRDASIEKLIDFRQKKTATNVAQHSPSSDNTSNDQESNELSFQLNNQSEDDQVAEQDDDDDDADGRELIMSLLSSRNANAFSINDLKREFIENQLEMIRRQKEKLAQQQQKQQLPVTGGRSAFSHSSISSLPPQVPSVHPPMKSNKFINDFNLHELSTIKEVDTPISERNLKVNTSAPVNNASNYNSCNTPKQNTFNNTTNNKSNTNLTEVSSLSSSSLENVTQLNSDNPLKQFSFNTTSQNNTINNNNEQSTVWSTAINNKPDAAAQLTVTNLTSALSSSLLDTTVKPDNNNLSHRLSLISPSAGSISDKSTSTPISTSSLSHTSNSDTRKPVNLDLIRQKQMLLLNMSLFDSTHSQTSQTSSLTSPQHGNPVLVKNSPPPILDDSTNQLMSMSEHSLTGSFSFKQTRRKTAAAKNTSKNLNTNNNNSNNVTNKKWFDILASGSEDEQLETLNESTNSSNSSSSSSTSLVQGQLSKSSSNSSSTSHMTSLLAETSLNLLNNQNNNNNINKSSLMSLSPTSILINYSLNSNKSELNVEEKTLREYMDNEMTVKSTRLGTSTSSGLATECASSTSGGLFDRFLKNYSSSYTATASVMDEPEISFVSCRSVETRYSTSSSSSSSSSAQSGVTNEESSMSLIQMQQRQLNKQFANMSPIDALSNEYSGLKIADSLSATIPFEVSSKGASKTSRQLNETNNSRQSSLILLSPSRLQDDFTDLVPPCVQKQNRSETSYASFDKPSQMSANYHDHDDDDDDDQRAIEKTLTFNNNNQTFALTNVSSMTVNNNGTGGQRNRSDSLVSFEHHELSQMNSMMMSKSQLAEMHHDMRRLSADKRPADDTTSDTSSLVFNYLESEQTLNTYEDNEIND